ncbi:hypothetical protein [Streptomyces niveus]
MTVHDIARALPAIPVLREHCRSLAVLDLVLNPGGVEPYYSFAPRWSAREEASLMSNGSGDEFHIVFSPAGAYIRGFDHESPMSPFGESDGPWPGVVDSVPEVFRHLVDEPAFSADDLPCLTACLWRETGGDRWLAGDIDFPEVPEGRSDPDGSGWLFRLLVDRAPEAYQRFAEDHYETAVDIGAVRHIYAGRPLTPAVVSALNPSAPAAEVAHEAAATGYAVAGRGWEA